MFPIHTHSYYSLLNGTIPVEKIISFAKKNGSGYAALTDTNGMYGLIQFAKHAGEENIKPVLGACINDLDEKNYAVFIARNNTGYSELCK
ncbi:MAG: PHP domain-containing protein, partial [Ignavibacteria bacterium]